MHTRSIGRSVMTWPPVQRRSVHSVRRQELVSRTQHTPDHSRRSVRTTAHVVRSAPTARTK